MKKWSRWVQLLWLRDRLFVMAAVGVLVSQATVAEPKNTNLAPLLTEADRVWSLNEQGDAIGAGRQSEAVVRAAEALRANGKPETARDYYRRAGLLRPWDLVTKQHYAEVLQQLGDTAAARNLAEQVEAYAETDRLLKDSRALMGTAPPPVLPPLASLLPAAGEVVVGLVAASGTERWLLNELGQRLSLQFGVRVGVAEEPFSVGAPNRSDRRLLAEQLRRSLPWTEDKMALYVPGGKPVPPERLSDQAVIATMQKLLDREGGPGQQEAFRAQLAQADAQQQWEATQLLDALSTKFVQPGQGRVVYLAVLPVDLFGGTANFLFGSATPGGNYGVISYHRFAAVFTGEPPSRTRLVERTAKQLLSSLGFALGVPRCADPRCARSYPSSLAEQDAKGAGLCADCRVGFAKALGHGLPVAAEARP